MKIIDKRRDTYVDEWLKLKEEIRRKDIHTIQRPILCKPVKCIYIERERKKYLDSLVRVVCRKVGLKGKIQ